MEKRWKSINFSSLEVVNISGTFIEESLECVIASFPRTVCKCIRLRVEAN